MLASQIEAGQSKPNPTFGIRSKATMASDEAWIATHEASLRILRGTVVFCSCARQPCGFSSPSCPRMTPAGR
ncbi:SdpI family protein [Paenarthrobacter aurescens]|nr:SdpI family protein [Paenarthrobacter aurescens]MDO6146352.1 SdpI family protein [Paenarthrobacter aurescens]MDO6157597.1 SdpI family protein [Paenarthrobacter aurescens]MDO6161582.1 SdpI family protein [Paenarthrobacter aurescens]